MKTRLILPLSLSLSAAVFTAACNKPVSQTTGETSTAAGSSANEAARPPTTASANLTDPGGAVSPPQPNGAVNTDANTTVADAAPASNSFTAGEAKSHIEHAGFTDVSNLQKGKDGLWVATAMKNGKSVGVTVDFKGAVTAN